MHSDMQLSKVRSLLHQKARVSTIFLLINEYKMQKEKRSRGEIDLPTSGTLPNSHKTLYRPTKARSQELHQGLLHGWQRPQQLSNPAAFASALTASWIRCTVTRIPATLVAVQLAAPQCQPLHEVFEDPSYTNKMK